MRCVLQRVRRAAVYVEGVEIASIELGILLFVGVAEGDDEESARTAAEKIAGLRLFADAAGRMNLAAGDVGGSFLVVSQFTLAASLARGRRPSFDKAMAPDFAEPLVERVAAEIELRGHPVSRGRFGAQMSIELVNDGPVTFVLDC